MKSKHLIDFPWVDTTHAQTHTQRRTHLHMHTCIYLLILEREPIKDESNDCFKVQLDESGSFYWCGYQVAYGSTDNLKASASWKRPPKHSC